MTRLRPKFGWSSGLLLTAVLAALAAGGSLIWRRTQVASAIPATPAPRSLHPQLLDEFSAGEKTARTFLHPVDGLAQLSRLYHANGFYPEAMQCYTALARLQPAEARWLHLHASILALFGRIDEALPLWRRAVMLAPDYLPVQIRLGDILTKANRGADAVAVYTDSQSFRAARFGAARYHAGQLELRPRALGSGDPNGS
jgi:tetratricopeptide (TPR) repeat protein